MQKLYASLAHAALLAAVLTMSVTTEARDRWTAAQANEWYEAQPWMIGVNYIPADADNELEMWQAASFNPKRIDMELGWAEGLGMNVVRVFLHDLLWEQDPAGFKQRIDKFLAITSKHHMRVLFVLFDSCWEAEPHLGPQNPPIPGIHNSRWAQSPGLTALRDQSREPRLEGYVKGIVGAFANDKRILGWDVWNEPGTPKPEDERRLIELMKKAFTWARAANPSQPLTSPLIGGWESAWLKDQPTEVEKAQLAEVDVFSLHNYSWPETFSADVTKLRALGRPVLCTEYLARGAGSTFDAILPVAKRMNVAMFNWGFVDGKTQTRLPWDSWSVPYINGREPVVWHHEVLHGDGTPYRQAEVELIRAYTQAPKGVVPEITYSH
jgi:hypothetical protein